MRKSTQAENKSANEQRLHPNNLNLRAEENVKKICSTDVLAIVLANGIITEPFRKTEVENFNMAC